jgi:hypothetical protein
LLYPHELSLDGKYVTVHSPALLSLDEVTDFHGQITPGITVAPPRNEFYDAYLFDALLARWKKRFVERKDTWVDTSLFRSYRWPSGLAQCRSKIAQPSKTMVRRPLSG